MIMHCYEFTTVLATLRGSHNSILSDGTFLSIWDDFGTNICYICMMMQEDNIDYVIISLCLCFDIIFW